MGGGAGAKKKTVGWLPVSDWAAPPPGRRGAPRLRKVVLWMLFGQKSDGSN